MSELTDDAFLGGRLKILQPLKSYRAGLDAVFLAGSVPAKPGDHVFEAGLGVGTATLCLMARVAGLAATGMELQPAYAELARQNAARNGHEINVLEGDIAQAKDLPQATYDHAFANPPYFDHGTVSDSPNALKANAHAFDAESFAQWIKRLHTVLKPKGTLTLVHRADSLSLLLQTLEPRFGALKIAPLYPRVGEPASRILVQGIKDSRANLTLLPGMVLHNEDHSFTPEAEAILRHGQSFTPLFCQK